MYSKNVALVFALTLTTLTQASPVQITAREQEAENSVVVARDPKFKFSTILKGASALAGVAGFALPFLGAGAGVSAQSVDIEVPTNATNSTLLSPKITPLSSANLKSLDARDPKFKFSSIFKGAGSLIGAAGFALPFLGAGAGVSAQSVDVEVPTNATNSTLLSPKITPLSSANLKSLDARDPKFKFSSIFKGAGTLLGAAGLVLPFLGSDVSTQSVDTEAPSNNGTETNTTLSAALTPFVARRSEEAEAATFLLSAFRDDIVLANPIVIQSPSIGTSATMALDCGSVTVTILQQEAFVCSFALPADMPAGTLTGQNPGQALSFEVSGDCVDVEFNVLNTCADCVAPLSVDCHGTVDGSDNAVALCANESTLAEC